MDYDMAFSMNNIQLDPRLQEYINMKRFNKENDITPDIPEAQQFGITPDDLKTIARHLKGRTYEEKSYKKNDHIKSHFVKADNSDSFFEDKNSFKNDPRYSRIQKKIQSHKDAQKQIRNFEGIDSDYKIFHRSNPYDDDTNPNIVRPQRIAKPYENDLYTVDDAYDAYNTNMSSRDELNYNRSKKNSEYRYDVNHKKSNRQSESSYNHKPHLSYRNTLIPQKVNGGLEHNHSANDVIGNLDNYGKFLNQTYEYFDYGDEASNSNQNNREQQNNYRNLPLGYGNGLADISVEDSLRGGIKDSRRKTTGIKNSFEHQFDYIDPEISNVNHTVNMRPQATRGANKAVARPDSNAYKAEQQFKKNMFYE